MPRNDVSLDRIEVATPCKASWDEMRGDDRVRACDLCKLNVYNLSGMKRAEAEAFVRKAEGRVCIRFYRRADGTVLAEDCPVGLGPKLKKKTIAAAAALVAFVGLGSLAGALAAPDESTPFGSVIRKLVGTVAPFPPAAMGRMVMPPRPRPLPVVAPPAPPPTSAEPDDEGA